MQSIYEHLFHRIQCLLFFKIIIIITFVEVIIIIDFIIRVFGSGEDIQSCPHSPKSNISIRISNNKLTLNRWLENTR